MVTAVPASLVVLLAVAGAAGAGDLPRHWPMQPSELEKRLAREDFTIEDAGPAGGGTTGPLKFRISFPDGASIKVKWKAVPPGKADGWNNSPRKEIAVYEVQKWIVDENDFLVPTANVHCFPVDKFRSIEPARKASLPGSTCVLGVLSVWLDGVAGREDFFDKKRFDSDPLYARYLADFNVLTYLVDHRDGRKGNLLLSTDAADPRVYAVDNGISFDTFPWNLRVFNWYRIHVPWLRRETVERLRNVDKARVRTLGVVAELEKDAAGRYHEVSPGPNIDENEGVRIRGNRIQFGLTDEEMHDVEERIQELLEKVDSGKIEVR